MSNTSTSINSQLEEDNLNQEENNLNQEEDNLNQEEDILNQEGEQEIFLQKFNKEFEEEQEIRKKRIVDFEKKKLRSKNYNSKMKNIHDLTLGEILINTKNTYMDIISELISLDYKDGIAAIFTKENRIFYIGVSLLILSFFIYIISFIFSSDDKNKEHLTESDKINIYINNPNKNAKIKDKNMILNKKKSDSEINNVSENISSDDNLNINNKIDTSELKVVEL